MNHFTNPISMQLNNLVSLQNILSNPFVLSSCLCRATQGHQCAAHQRLPACSLQCPAAIHLPTTGQDPCTPGTMYMVHGRQCLHDRQCLLDMTPMLDWRQPTVVLYTDGIFSMGCGNGLLCKNIHRWLKKLCLVYLFKSD